MESAAATDLISVVVVAADSGPLLQRCVAATLASRAAVELIIVDNASSDGEVDGVATSTAADPRVKILRNQKNLGFGTACNRGARIARGEVIVFMNPDCEFADDVLPRMRDRLLVDRSIGLLGVCVRDECNRRARGNRRRDPNVPRVLATMSGLARLESRWPTFAGIEMPDSLNTEVGEIEHVEAISGACMGIRNALFRTIGGFDEAFFLHFEDLDLCRRVRNSGRSVAFDHTIQVVHRQGSSSHHRAGFVTYHKHDGLWRYLLKHDERMHNIALWALTRFCLLAHSWVTRIFLRDAGINPKA